MSGCARSDFRNGRLALSGRFRFNGRAQVQIPPNHQFHPVIATFWRGTLRAPGNTLCSECPGPHGQRSIRKPAWRGIRSVCRNRDPVLHRDVLRSTGGRGPARRAARPGSVYGGRIPGALPRQGEAAIVWPPRTLERKTAAGLTPTNSSALFRATRLNRSNLPLAALGWARRANNHAGAPTLPLRRLYPAVAL
jgi:hypothetical protein